MATDKDKGLLGGASDIVGGATDGLRETTTGALRGGGPWHSPNSDVYHNNPSCQTGNSIAPENVRQGTGDRERATSPFAGSAIGSTARADPWATSPACRSVANFSAPPR